MDKFGAYVKESPAYTDYVTLSDWARRAFSPQVLNSVRPPCHRKLQPAPGADIDLSVRFQVDWVHERAWLRWQSNAGRSG